jgi:3-oxoacyl-(acyl-carrier-protein) synthase
VRSGATAVGEAFRNIRHGYQDAVIAGGTEASLCGLGVGGFIAMRALSTRNDEPERGEPAVRSSPRRLRGRRRSRDLVL